MKKEELLEKYENLGLFNEDEEFTTVIATENGIMVKGNIGRILGTITSLLHDLYEDGDVTEKDIKDIARLSTINVSKVDEINDLVKKIKEMLED